MRLAILLSFAALVLAQSPSALVQPRVLSRTEPPYSEEARRARVNAFVTLTFFVNTDGIPENIQVLRPAGFGLDEQAVQTVSTWRFEPGTKDGIKVRSQVSVEVAFRIQSVEGTAKLNFTLPSGQTRPELLSGKLPANPKEGDNLRIALSVGTDGKPREISVLDTNSPKWAEDAAREMKDWRFRPASLNGSPMEVMGVFELTRPVLNSTIGPGIGAASRPPSSPPVSAPKQSYTVDASLPAPKLISPADGTVFENGYPRRTIFQWEPSSGAVSYLFEWDYSYNGVWNAEEKKMLGMGFPVQSTQYTLDFVGAQPGRWRVWPVNAAGQRGLPSEWRGFRYLQ